MWEMVCIYTDCNANLNCDSYTLYPLDVLKNLSLIDLFRIPIKGVWYLTFRCKIFHIV